MRTAIFFTCILFFSIFSRASSCHSEVNLVTSDRCLKADTTKSNVILIILDRTTKLDDNAKSRWETGVNAIFSNPNVTGDLHVVEVRENVNGMQYLARGCIDSFDAQPKIERNEIKLSEHPFEWLMDYIQRYYWKSREEEPSFEDVEEVAHVRKNRRLVASEIGKFGEKDFPTYSESEISQSILSAVKSFCTNRKECYVYIFSDLLDSVVKRAINNDTSKIRALAASRSTELISEYNIDIADANLHIIVWGFGRDDVRTGASLSEGYRQKLRLYWDIFLGEIIKKASKQSSIQIYDILQ